MILPYLRYAKKKARLSIVSDRKQKKSWGYIYFRYKGTRYPC